MEGLTILSTSAAYVVAASLVGCLASALAGLIPVHRIKALRSSPLNPHLSHVPLAACASQRAAHVAASRKLARGLAHPRDVYVAIMLSASASRLSFTLRVYAPVLIPC